MAHLIDKSALVAEIKRRRESNAKERYFGRLVEDNYFLDFLDTLEMKDLQEESVSIWHDSNKEQPNFASSVAIWNPKYKNGEIISRCTEVYSDRIWAYIDDLLKM